MKKVAQENASRGHRVHPLREGDKTPNLKGWQRLASTNTKDIDGWWERWPNANIGIVIQKGEVVVDVDSPRAHDEFLERVPVKGVPTVRTPSGGWHYLYRGNLPGRVLVRSDDGGRALEVKGARANRVAPGSVTSKGRYTLAVDLPTPPAPAELVTWVQETKVGKAGPDVRVGRGDLAGRSIWKGERNVMLFKLGAHMRRIGGTPTSIEAFLLAHNQEWCKPPLADDEVREIAANIVRYPFAPEWALDPLGSAAHVAEAYGLSASDQAVLAALYNSANDKGLVTRGVRRLARETRLHTETVSIARQRLLAVDVVAVVRTSRQFGTTYKVDDVLAPKAPPGRDGGGPSVRISGHLSHKSRAER
jgi:hypothetical protein